MCVNIGTSRYFVYTFFTALKHHGFLHTLTNVFNKPTMLAQSLIKRRRA